MGFFSKVFSPVKKIVKSVVGVVSSVVKAVVSIATSVIDFALQLFMPDIPGIDGANEAARQQGVLVQKQGSDISIPVLYGFRKMAGAIVYMETGSTNNKFLWVAYVFAEGQIEGVKEIFIDDFQLNSKYISKLNGGDTVSVDEGKYAGRVQMRWSPGVYHSDPATSTLNTSVRSGVFNGAPNFTTDMHFNGVATLFVRYEFFQINTQKDADNNPFSGSVPRIHLNLLGKRVASLVTTTSENFTYGGVGYTERYSTNPAECLLDYLRNPRYGKGLANTELDWATFRNTASKLNTEVEYTAGVTGVICTTNAVLDTAQTLTNNVKILLHGMRSYMPYVQGVYKLRVEDAGDPTDILSGTAVISAIATTDPTLTNNDLANSYIDIQGDVSYSGIERSAKYTQVLVTYVDPQQGFSNQQVAFPETEAERQAFITADGGRENTLQVTMGTITNRFIALDFARLMFNKSRQQETCSLTVSTRGMELEPGDIIRIQGTLLNFNTTPWRIVSLEYNDDYTVKLGCVRNPESIYPHTRLNEADIINGVFRPDGGTIITPQVPSAAPPNKIVHEDTGNNDTNPPPTDTTDTSGDTAVSTPVSEAPEQDSQPDPAPQITVLDTVVDFGQITFTRDETGQIYGTINWLQPDHPQYDSLDIYFRIFNSPTWTYLNISDKPGIGKNITADIGPLFLGANPLYDLRARVKYSTGEVSTQFVSSQFTVSATSGATQDIREFIQIDQGNFIEQVEVEQATRRDDRIQWTATMASLGSVGTNRTMSFTIAQDSLTTAPNPDIQGYTVYHKASSATFYTRTLVDFPVSFVPGSSNTQTFSGDLGVSGGPTAYDFVLRLRYRDGTESTQQFRKTIQVESPVAVYPYTATGGANSRNEAISSFSFQTVDQAPPGAVGSVLDTQLGIRGINEDVTNSVKSIRLLLEPPDAADLVAYRGAKISYRPVVPGTNPPLKTFVDKQQKNTAGTIGPVFVSNIDFDQKYEIIITPQVLSGGSVVNATSSLFGTGLVHNRSSSGNYPVDANWLNSFNMVKINTNTALKQSEQAFDPADPTVSVISCRNVQNSLPDGTGTRRTGAGTYELTDYIELKIDKSDISGFTKLHIYRRTRPFSSGGFSVAKYWSTGGQWEHIEVDDTSNPPVGDITTINLRGAIREDLEFSSKFQVSGNERDPRRFLNIKIPEPIIINQGSKLPYETRMGKTELLLVVETTGSVFSSFATHLDGKNTHQFDNDWLTPNRPEIVAWAKYNTDYDAGFFRRIDEARAPAVVSNLAITAQIPNTTRSLAYPTLTPPLI